MAQAKTSQKPAELHRVTDSRWFYRLWEIIPGFVSWAVILSPIYLSLIAPVGLAYLIIAFDIMWLLKSVRMSWALIRGYNRLQYITAQDWEANLRQLKDVSAALQKTEAEYAELAPKSNQRVNQVHLNKKKRWLRGEVERLRLLESHEATILNPDDLYQVIILAAYNEPPEIIEPSVNAILNSDYDMSRVIFVMAYEQRGGEAMAKTARELQKKYHKQFADYLAVCHPSDIAGELKGGGKGPNITYAGRAVKDYIEKKAIDPEKVLVTTVDADNRLHKRYLSRLSYAYCINPNRLHTSFQPIALFLNNIWDVPAPIRVVAWGNSIWPMIESIRAPRLRNFATHAQSLQTLIDTDFWSVTSPVEDGHQFWRTYFTYDGDHVAEPLFVPVYQDAVLAARYHRTFLAQYKQLRRWAYGVSDVPYMVKNSIQNKQIPWGNKLVQFGRLFEGHFSWATVPVLLTFAAWAPLFLNPSFNQQVLAHQLPVVASRLLTFATAGIFITIWISFLLLPTKPARYHHIKFVSMLLQWILMPVIGIAFGSFAAIDAQTRLMLGRYLGFTVTEKAVKK
ncbi:glycosyltransferase family 2 protein [Candidatus Saccharibacteria bacterium]|nr:glycosyltransferase family 2 protein [Candidatus Saccharibacteria bacterium]